MVPDRMFRVAERLTGNWWLTQHLGCFGRKRLRLMVEIEVGWASGVPPMPGRDEQICWCKGARPAARSEIDQILAANWPAFTYQPNPAPATMPDRRSSAPPPPPFPPQEDH